VSRFRRAAAALVVAFLGLALEAAEPSATTPERTRTATTVVLVRHAEKTYRNRDSDLSGIGRKRAEALVAELRPLAPEALYASSMRRTQQTLAPLAASLRLPVTVRPIGDEEAVAAEILARHRGGVVVVCGHSETLTRFVSALGWDGDFPVVQAFDRIWTVTVPASGEAVSLTERRQSFVRR
jgi:phosphohistidine phosphatase SixA